MTTSEVELPKPRLIHWAKRTPPSPDSSLPALAPYRSLSRHRLRNFFAVAGLMLFCLIYGFAFSLFAPSNFAFFTFPLLVLVFLVIWALPDLHRAPTRTLETLFFATFIGLVVWPNYLAIALPGLPWITVLRLTSLPLLFTLLICISISEDFRTKLTRSLRSIPSIPTLLCIFVAIQFVSIGFSADRADSIQKFIVAQTTWTAIYFVSAYVFLAPHRIKHWAIMLWAMAVFVSALAIWEFIVGHLPWRDHIPGFLQIQDEAVQRIIIGSVRAGTTRYRSHATFSTPLGLAEYIALSLPFVLHFGTTRFAQRTRLAAIFSIPIMLIGCYLTDAKLGMVGCLFGILLYMLAAAIKNWKRNKHSLLAASILFSYPAAVVMLLGALIFVHRFQVLVLGTDGSHANSTDARVVQYTTGFQKLLEWPFGYGVGMGAPTLGFGRDIGGMITIDTYYLSVLLEYGIAGFIAYYGMFAIAIWEGGRRDLRSMSQSNGRSFLLPISISLIVFIVIKSVFSQQDNHPIVFMMLGALTALAAPNRKTSAIPETRNARKPLLATGAVLESVRIR